MDDDRGYPDFRKETYDKIWLGLVYGKIIEVLRMLGDFRLPADYQKVTGAGKCGGCL